ncbi:MAG TPA: hypothetical protein VJI12_03470 [archaeon]|nr:hypothetical protein [archaeon]
MGYVDSRITEIAVGMLKCDRPCWQNHSYTLQIARLLADAQNMPAYDIAYYMNIIEARLPRTTDTLQ